VSEALSRASFHRNIRRCLVQDAIRESLRCRDASAGHWKSLCIIDRLHSLSSCIRDRVKWSRRRTERAFLMGVQVVRVPFRFVQRNVFEMSDNVGSDCLGE